MFGTASEVGMGKRRIERIPLDEPVPSKANSALRLSPGAFLAGVQGRPNRPERGWYQVLEGHHRAALRDESPGGALHLPE